MAPHVLSQSVLSYHPLTLWHAPCATLALQLSPECKDLLNRIFVIDAKKRITIEDIERHPWCAVGSCW